MIDDSELLRRYVEGSESAFTEFVQRHVNLVYTAALRRVGNDRQLAEEITQTVFTQCARKAKALRQHPALSGWLHGSTRFAAIDSLRARKRRTATEAIETMNSAIDDATEAGLAWKEIRPVIDGLLDRLGEVERRTVMLRFFEGHSFAEIGARLRISEDTARMRVDRALEKLRQALARRGVGSTTATLGLALGTHAVRAAPLGLAHTVSTVAATAAGSGVAAGTIFIMSKAKVGAAVAALAMGLTAVVFESRDNLELQNEATSLRRAAEKMDPSTSPAASATPVPPALGASAELGRLRARIAELKARPDGVVDAEIRWRNDWKNAGHASPEDAFETFIWAGETNHYDALAESFFLGDETMRDAQAYFATLSPELRAAYGTAERLLAPFVAERPKAFRLEAVQVIEVLPGNRPDEMTVRYWARTEGGRGRIDALPFRRVGDQWRMGSRQMGLSVSAAIDFTRSRLDPRLPAYAGKR